MAVRCKALSVPTCTQVSTLLSSLPLRSVFFEIVDESALFERELLCDAIAALWHD